MQRPLSLSNAACPSAAPSRSVNNGTRLRCTDDVASSRVELLVGVHSAPGNRLSRTAIRSSWMQWESVGSTVLVCFIVGRQRLSKARTGALEAEAAEHHDMLLLDVIDQVVLTLPKTFGWWMAASRMLPSQESSQVAGPRWVAKVDDDSFVHLPNLQADLRSLHCHPILYYGSFAFSGYDPNGLSKCGFSWQGAVNFDRLNCRSRGAQPPTPFALGAVQVVAATLLRSLARAPGLAEYVARANERRAEFSKKHDAAEDVALGHWLARAHAAEAAGGNAGSVSRGGSSGSGSSSSSSSSAGGGGDGGGDGGSGGIDYVRTRSNGVVNMDCFKRRGMYQVPSGDTSVVVHHLKRPEGMRYLWRLLHGGAAHDADACLTATVESGFRNARIFACNDTDRRCRMGRRGRGRPRTVSCQFDRGQTGRGRADRNAPLRPRCCACGFT